MRSLRCAVHHGLTVFTIGALALTSLTCSPDAEAQAATTPCDPPAVFPIERLRPGMQATGWTVVQGTEPSSFAVEVLGVQPDAIAPGFDVIVVKASGRVIERIGGIAAGFSGSPVYRGDRLVGSISWRTDGDAHYAGLTPGSLLVGLLDQPDTSAPSPRSVALDGSLRRAIARDAGVALAEAPATMSQVPVALALSGVSADRTSEVADRFAERGLSAVPYLASASTATRAIEAEPLHPGDSFVAALSYGTVTYAAIGSVTIACGDHVVAFGHPFTHAGGGRSSAAMGAEVVTVVPGDYPFKMANVGTLRGVVDQDRLAGVRAIRGIAPHSAVVRARIENRDMGSTLRTVTRVTDAEWLGDVAWDHVYASIYAGLDADRGSVAMRWTVEGMADGAPFSITMRNAYSGSDVTWGPAGDASATMWSLRNAPGHLKVTRVSVDATVREREVGVAKVHHPRTASDLMPDLKVRRTIDVRPGDTLRVKVPVVSPGGRVVQVARSFSIPDTATGSGRLEIQLGNPGFWVEADTVKALLWRLQNQLSSDELRMRLRVKGLDRPVNRRIAMPWLLEGEPISVRLNVERG